MFFCFYYVCIFMVSSACINMKKRTWSTLQGHIVVSWRAHTCEDIAFIAVLVMFMLQLTNVLLFLLCMYIFVCICILVLLCSCASHWCSIVSIVYVYICMVSSACIHKKKRTWSTLQGHIVVSWLANIYKAKVFISDLLVRIML